MGRLLLSTVTKRLPHPSCEGVAISFGPDVEGTRAIASLDLPLANFSTGSRLPAYFPPPAQPCAALQPRERNHHYVPDVRPFWLDGPRRARVDDARCTRICSGDSSRITQVRSTQPSNDGVQLTEDQRSKVRGAYARSWKPGLTHDDVISPIREYRHTH
jgi:hypothetical protein